jgi:putative ABC transport system substrate-binding protein
LPEDLDSAFASLAESKPDALHIVADAATLDLADRISAFAIAQRIPLFTTYPPIAELGGLLGYGPSFSKMLGRAGYYVKRLMEGANPSDIPVEQPIDIELSINLKTAKTLGIVMPPQLERLANNVVE